jgi:predicted heme/steroid binding protein/uncharacterized membrane protein
MEVSRMKEFDPEELERFDGKENRPAYVVYKGSVYDVSGSKLWKGGLHMNRHHAGKDLATDIQAAPHEPSVLERYPQVGTVKKNEGNEMDLPFALSWLLNRAPFFRRHPHPMTIHFPIAFTFAALVFNLLYFATGITSFDNTAFHCLGAAVFFTPVAILTGFYTWWLNYGAKSIRPVRIKQRLSFLLLALECVLFFWRFMNPTLVQSPGWRGMVYSLLLLAMFVVVTVIGWFGAGLTFPIEKPVAGE